MYVTYIQYTVYVPHCTIYDVHIYTIVPYVYVYPQLCDVTSYVLHNILHNQFVDILG